MPLQKLVDGALVDLTPEEEAEHLAGQTPTPSVADIKREAQRRIILLCGAPDFNSCITKQLNALMRVGELNNKMALGLELTPDEQAEAASLQAMADSIKAIRAASNVIEGTLPIDYASDVYWP